VVKNGGKLSTPHGKGSKTHKAKKLQKRDRTGNRPKPGGGEAVVTLKFLNVMVKLKTKPGNRLGSAIKRRSKQRGKEEVLFLARKKIKKKPASKKGGVNWRPVFSEVSGGGTRSSTRIGRRANKRGVGKEKKVGFGLGGNAGAPTQR